MIGGFCTICSFFFLSITNCNGTMKQTLQLHKRDYLQKCKCMLWFNRISRRQSPIQRVHSRCAHKLNTLAEYRHKSNTKKNVYLFPGFCSRFHFLCSFFLVVHFLICNGLHYKMDLLCLRKYKKSPQQRSSIS